MILTEAYFRKINALMLPKERQALEDTLDEAQTVIKKAHGKGVELECILEVNNLILYLKTLFDFTCKQNMTSTFREKCPGNKIHLK